VDTSPDFTGGTTVSVTVVDNLLYHTQVTDVPGCACALHISNVTNPLAPQPVSHYYTSNSAQDVAVVGDVTYLAAGDLDILDVSNPARPERLSLHHTPANAMDVAVSGSYAFVADSSRYNGGNPAPGGLRVLNVEDSNSPAEVGFYETTGWAQELAVQGENIFLASGEEGLLVLRYTGGGEPFISGRIADAAGRGVPDLLVSADGYTDTTDSNGVYTFNGLTPGEYTVSVAFTPYYTFSPASRTVAVPPNGTAQNFTVTATTSWNVELAGQLDVEVERMVVQGDYAYASHADGFRVIDVSNPVDPIVVGQAEIASQYGSGGDLAVAGSYAYVAHSSSLYVYDVSNPATPVNTDVYQTDDGISDVALVGNYLYLANSASGLRVLIVEDPFNVTEVGNTTAVGVAEEILIRGKYAYVSDSSVHNQGKVHILDLSNPATPAIARTLYLGDRITSIEVADNYLYIAWAYADRNGFWSGLRLYDVTNPASAGYIGGYDAQQLVYDVFVAEGNVYLAEGERGLRVLSPSDSTMPSEVGFYNTPGEAALIVPIDDYLYVKDGQDTSLILRFGEPVPTSITLDALRMRPLSIGPLVFTLPFSAGVVTLLFLRRRRQRAL
jgi:hypothetical protein